MSALATEVLKRVDAALGPLACSALSRRQRTPEARTLADFPSGAAVLVARPGGVGDAVLLLPAVAALRKAFPESPVDVLCESRNAMVFEASGMFRRIYRYDANPVSTIAALFRGKWAVFCDTEQFHHASAAMGAVSGAPVRVGFAVNPARLGLYDRTVPYDSAGRESEQFARVFRAAAGVPLQLPPLGCILNPESLPPPPDGLPARFAAVHVGGSVARKRWGAHNWSRFAAALHAKTGLAVVFVGGKGDARDGAAAATGAQAIAAAASGAASHGAFVDLCGKMPLRQTCSVLSRAKILVGPDSGLAHLSVATGTPALALFGPGDPAKWGPPQGMGRAISASVPCSPCSLHGAVKPCRRAWCMEGITPEAALEAALDILKSVPNCNSPDAAAKTTVR